MPLGQDAVKRFRLAGADALFVEAPRSDAELRGVVATFGGRAPLTANMVEGGATPLRTARDLEALGFSLVIFPGGVVGALAHTAADHGRSLAAHGPNAPFAGRMFDFAALNDRIDTAETLAAGRRYADPAG